MVYLAPDINNYAQSRLIYADILNNMETKSITWNHWLTKWKLLFKKILCLLKNHIFLKTWQCFSGNTHLCALKVYIGSTSREALLNEVQKNVNKYMISHTALQKCARIAKFLKSLLHLLKCFSYNFLCQHEFSYV